MRADHRRDGTKGLYPGCFNINYHNTLHNKIIYLGTKEDASAAVGLPKEKQESYR